MLKVAVTASVMMCAAQAIAAAPPASVERFEIVSDGPAFGGRIFEGIGRYRHIEAVAHVRIDPAAPANKNIVDLDKAPRGPDGLVHYSADVVMLVPADPAKARRVLVAEVPNRGMRLMSPLFEAGQVLPEFTPRVLPLDKAESAGTGFIERRGYSFVWIGWQDKVRGIKASFPAVLENGRPVSGRIHISSVFDKAEPEHSWSLAYPAASTDRTGVELTVRANQASSPVSVPAEDWSFADSRTIKLRHPAGIDAGAIFELVYTATDATVTGLGFAATRDVIAFLRSGKPDGAGGPAPLAGLSVAPCAWPGKARCAATAGQAVDFAIGMGGSQSGRYLRDMLYQGFNDDGQGHRIFDGMIPFLSGSRKTFTNRRWAEPGRFSRQHEERQVYGDQFPFTYATTTDQVTGKSDGLMVACLQTRTCPKTMQVDTSAEFWMAGASLVGTTADGKQDIAFPADVRAYLIASGTHQTRNGSPVAQFPGNNLASGPLLRALLVDLEDWVAKDEAPPPSRWPRVADGMLGDPGSRAGFGFPDLSAVGLTYRGSVYRLNVIDYSTVPPREDLSRPYKILVPRTDADGNDRPGVRLPDVAVPIGTYLGWNPRKAGFAEGQQATLAGSFIAFAPDAASRKAGDPRPSLAERYGTTAAYVQRVRAAGEALQRDRLMLPADVAEAVTAAQAVTIGR